MRWLTHGVSFDFVPVHSADQQRAPHYKRNVRIVSQHLRSRGLDAEALLGGSRPQRVHLPNHASAAAHPAFVTDTIRDCLAKGVMARISLG